MEDSDYVSPTGVNLAWSKAQTGIVMLGVQNECSTKVIMRNLQDANAFPIGKFPSSSQLNVKIRYCRQVLQKSVQILNTNQLRTNIEERLDEPVDETEAYFALHSIDDELRLKSQDLSISGLVKNISLELIQK